jgi:hypothetical protein
MPATLDGYRSRGGDPAGVRGTQAGRMSLAGRLKSRLISRNGRVVARQRLVPSIFSSIAVIVRSH